MIKNAKKHSEKLDKKAFENSSWSIQLSDKSTNKKIILHRKWKGTTCSLSVENTGPKPVRISEISVFRCDIPYPANTPFYGEGYDMLSQYKGTISAFENITNYTNAHYKLPQKDNAFTVYNMLMLFPTESDIVLMGFASCHHFSGEFRFNINKLDIVMDCENLEVGAGETLMLEEFYLACGTDREALLDSFGKCIEKNHPRLEYPEAPTGWCSWYCYGPGVTQQDIIDNLKAIKKDLSGLEFIQLDDGYQKAMGDWFIPHPNFPDIKTLCLKIKEAGFEPGIWVASFIAGKDSEILKIHPDWFIKDDNGKPLCSADVSYGGWRLAPWYMLDGTHPEAQEFLKNVFRKMHEEWQCRYFKLDANTWGALPFGHHYDPKATKIDAFRAGMQAILEGAGKGSFILGCNAPMWPSIGVVHGMRITDDIYRVWQCFKSRSEECFNRNWQNQHLWFNDPDCIVINSPDDNQNKTSEDEFLLHSTQILASGGMLLSGDKIMKLKDKQKNIIKKLISIKGKAAKFDDRSFRIGRIDTDDGLLLCLFNKGDTESLFSVPLNGKYKIRDFWTDEKVADNVTCTPILRMPPHSARALYCTKK